MVLRHDGCPGVVRLQMDTALPATGISMRLTNQAIRRRSNSLWCGVLCVCAALPVASQAEDEQRSQSFAQALAQVRLAGYRKIAEYVRQNPRAADVHEAYDWLLQSQRDGAAVAETLVVAEQYLKRDDVVPHVARAARRVRVVGLARSGDLKTSLALFEAELQGVSLRAPEPMVALGMEVMSEAQLHADLSAARAAVNRLSTAFFLNPFVRRQCDARLRKLELVEHPAPAISLTNLQGQAVEVSQFAGKVLLVDFWATNCAPCLEEFPNLKRLYRDFHPQGLEVIGISLDTRRQAIVDFQEKWELPWPLAIHGESRNGPRLRYRVETIPSMFLIDRSGKVAAIDLKGDVLRRAVAQLIDDRPKTPRETQP